MTVIPFSFWEISTSSPPKSLVWQKGFRRARLLTFRSSSLPVGAICLPHTCKNVWDSVGTQRDFILGNPAAFAACTGCWVDECRWFRPHFSVKAVLDTGRWISYVTKAKTFTPIWPALWLPALDKSRTSSNKEVQQVWLVYEERLKTVDLQSVMRIEKVYRLVIPPLHGRLGLMLLKALSLMLTVLPGALCRLAGFSGLVEGGLFLHGFNWGEPRCGELDLTVRMRGKLKIWLVFACIRLLRLFVFVGG